MRYEVSVKLNKDFIKEENGRIMVGIKSKPEAGKANLELIKKLSKYFKVPTSFIKIKLGKTSKIKVVNIIK